MLNFILWVICNLLLKENKMGNIIDITNRIQNFKNIYGSYKNVLTRKFGDTFSIINSYIVPNDNSIKEYDNFKQWFLKIWDKKDNILDIILTKNDKFTYKKLKANIQTSDYILLVFVITLFIYMCINTKGLFCIFALIITYIITFIKYKKLL